MGEKIDAENVDELGFPITCDHLDDREKSGNIPLEHSADMAVCKECYVRLTPAVIVKDEAVDVPDGVVPGELVKTPGEETADNTETEGGREIDRENPPGTTTSDVRIFGRSVEPQYQRRDG